MYFKKIIFACILLFIIKSISAQPSNFRIGVRGGLNMSTAFVHDGNSKFKQGYHIGGTVDYALTQILELQSGLFFSKTGSIINGFNADSYIGGKPDHTFTFNTSYLKLPLYIAYRKNISGNMNFNTGLGPYFGYGIGGKTIQTLHSGVFGGSSTEREWDTFGSNEAIETLNRFDFGAGANAGVEFHKFVLGVGFETSIINVMYKKEYLNPFRYRNVNIGIFTGYRF